MGKKARLVSVSHTKLSINLKRSVAIAYLSVAACNGGRGWGEVARYCIDTRSFLFENNIMFYVTSKE